MDEAQTLTTENLIDNWNVEFPDYQLTAADLKNPHAVMGAVFQIFDRLGIDRDEVLSPPPEDKRSENTIYYWDLIPVINVTRVINQLAMPNVVKISITHFLQPTVTATHSILLLLFNLMLFNDQKLREIAPHEEELFAKADEVKSLEDHKNRLLEMLNQQAEEKGKRAERLEKLDEDIKQFKEELKQETAALDEEKLALDMIQKENHQLELVRDQKKGLKEAILAEVERKRALRVYDADDVKAQAEQAAQNVQEAEEKLNSLRAILMEKENSLKNLQIIKPSLDTANNLLHEIMKLSESLKDCESGDLESDSKEGELDVLNTELSELEAQLSETAGARAAARARRQEAHAKRHQDLNSAQSALRDAEDKDKKCREKCKKALQRTEEIKQMTLKYEEEKNMVMEELAEMQTDFTNELKSLEDILVSKAKEVKRKIEDKLRIRNLK